MRGPIKYYCDPNFKSRQPSGVFSGFFSRIGGASEGIYKGLNCGTGSNDEKDIVIENRSLVQEEAGASYLLSLYQEHGSKVLQVTEPWLSEDRPKADGFVTDVQGIALGILTADCAPVLFYGQKKDGKPVVGAAHAGWKGALFGVLEEAVDNMALLGVEKDSIHACIGPCISKNSYEVNKDFAEPFFEHHKDSERFFMSGKDKEHLFFDLGGYCVWRLYEVGIKNISVMDMDTYANDHDFFSYRRSTHRGEKDYGRQISVIGIQK